MCIVCQLISTPIPVKFDRQGHSCNYYAGFGPIEEVSPTCTMMNQRGICRTHAAYRNPYLRQQLLYLCCPAMQMFHIPSHVFHIQWHVHRMPQSVSNALCRMLPLRSLMRTKAGYSTSTAHACMHAHTHKYMHTCMNAYMPGPTPDPGTGPWPGPNAGLGPSPGVLFETDAGLVVVFK